MGDRFFDPTVGALRAALNLRQVKTNVINSNVANADTPGYKQKKVEFERALRSAINLGDDLPLATSSSDHIVGQRAAEVEAEVFEDPNGVESLDGNTVNRSEQMVELSENQVLYNAGIEALRRKLAMMKYAITEGGGNR